MWNSLNILFNVFGLILLGQFIRYKIDDYKNSNAVEGFWTFGRHKYVLTVAGLLITGFIIIEWILPEVSPLNDELKRGQFKLILGMLTALGISTMWTVYLRKLDIFDPERWVNIFWVFLLGCATVFLVFPISRFVNSELHFNLNGEALNDFLYCFIGIGMLEEFVKLLPLLVVIRFKKIVREPYDFLLYASVAALAFAFVENSLYIRRTEFIAVNGRALMATVAHMTFSSVVGYSVMVSSYKKSIWGWRYFIGGFILASLMHGFYDFWLINPVVKHLNGLTFLFFMLTTHFWFTMKNKTINASRFFSHQIDLANDSLRYFLIFWLTVILIGSAILIGVYHGSIKANDYLRGQIYAYGFLIYYLSYSFSRFKLSPKMLSATSKAMAKVIPDEPKISPDPNPNE